MRTRAHNVLATRRRAASPRRSVPAALVCGLAIALLAAAAAPAGADVFGPISLISQGALGGGGAEQAEYAHDPAISGDGRYVAFDGSIGGVTGVWRRDLKTGELEQVAGGDAELPSISDNGRYVSFTTNEGLSLPEVSHGQPDSSPHGEAVNVYVRDMAVQPATSAAEEAARWRRTGVHGRLGGGRLRRTPDLQQHQHNLGLHSDRTLGDQRRRRRGGVRHHRGVESGALSAGGRRRNKKR